MKEIKRFWENAEISGKMILIGVISIIGVLHVVSLGIVTIYLTKLSFLGFIIVISFLGGLLLAFDGLMLSNLKEENDFKEWAKRHN